MRILLLSAYHSASHRYWCEGLMAALPEFDWTLKTQPARHFSWRVRASAGSGRWLTTRAFPENTISSSPPASARWSL